MIWLLNRLSRLLKKEKPMIHPSKRRTVLAVDDDKGQRTLIAQTLQKRGHRVLEAENGHQGLELAMAHRPDLILLDHIMPDIDGLEVCRRLKAEESTREIAVIFLTSRDSPDDIIEHYETGADIHLTKPINPRELILQCEETLEIGE